MAHEGGYYRFFAYLNLFMFFMLILVLAANFLLLFVGWEGVGLCSYLLIGFYFLKKSATNAGNKAFIVNRIGDFGFSLADVPDLHPLQVARLRRRVPGGEPESRRSPPESSRRSACCCWWAPRASPRRFRSIVWLPDAMEGPTPVSALIHAATMVTAGVYMVARCAADLPARAAGAGSGGAGSAWRRRSSPPPSAWRRTTSRRSSPTRRCRSSATCSWALGAGAFSAGIFHLVTHAFFKALLFLGAGSVIHALSGEQDLRNMGGLRKNTPITFLTILCAAVAIAGVPPFSGFHSKDAILLAAYHHAPWMYWVGVLTAGMTAFYVFRAMFLAFFGEYRGHAHPHESPAVMTMPLAALAVLSLGGRLLQRPALAGAVVPGDRRSPRALAGRHFRCRGPGGNRARLSLLRRAARPGRRRRRAVGRALTGWSTTSTSWMRSTTPPSSSPLVEGSRDGPLARCGRRADRRRRERRGRLVAASIGGVLRLLQSGNIRSYAAWVVLGFGVAILAIGRSSGGRDDAARTCAWPCPWRDSSLCCSFRATSSR